MERLHGSAGALGEYAAAELPALGTLAGDLRLLAIDVETTGLDPRRDHLLSIGFVPIDGYEIKLAGARTLHVRPPEGEGGVGASATIHGLTDDMLVDGLAPAVALEQVLQALAGRVLLAHHAPIETGFLTRLAKQAHGTSFPVRVIDTMELGRRMLDTNVQPLPRNALRLWTLRDGYGLPVYPAHDALQDALACGELYLAQLSALEEQSREPLTLKHLGG